MYDEKEVKGYQRGFLSAVGISVEEALNYPEDDLWDLIYSFCGLNDIALIIEEEDRLLLGTFCGLHGDAQKRIVNDFYRVVLDIRHELKREPN